MKALQETLMVILTSGKCTTYLLEQIRAATLTYFFKEG